MEKKWGNMGGGAYTACPSQAKLSMEIFNKFLLSDYSKFGSTEVTRKEEGKESPVFCSQISLLLSNRGLGKSCVLSNCSAYV